MGKLEFKFIDNKYITEDELVEVYQCNDKSWRVQYFPYADRDRNLSREEAFCLAEKRHPEAVKVYENTLKIDVERGIYSQHG